ncbi:MAG: hypothetical protein OXQ89_17865 [Rhodospirillaceae bacterium]|nr:hypothetical protein [Rhodospirillaceae bacterium]MDD9999609.1 hypothetical protein [Rhodospirillaceae bacterium]
MRDGYRLEPTENVHRYMLVTPFGEPIAEIERHAYGFEIQPIVEGIGYTQDFQLQNIGMTIDGAIMETSGYPLMENACNPYVEAHYKLVTGWHRRWGEKFTGFTGNPLWPWLFGLIATIVAIWGWLD